MLYIVPRNSFLRFKLMQRTTESVPLLGRRPVAHTSTTAQVAFTASIEASVRSDSRSRRCTSYDSASGAPHATQTLGLRSSQQGSDTSSTPCHAISYKSNYEILINSVSREDATCDADTRIQKPAASSRHQLNPISFHFLNK